MNPLFPTLVLSLSAFVLLVLVTFSTPFVPVFYFLQASVPGDTVRFGIWGYCFQHSGECSRKALGYSWPPEIIAWMTKTLVFQPIAACFTFLALVSLVPAITARRRDAIFPPPLYSLLVIPAALMSLIAFCFTIGLFAVARKRFHQHLEFAAFGPLPWMSLAATVLLLFLVVYSGCGVTWRGPFGQNSPHIRNRWSAVYAY